MMMTDSMYRSVRAFSNAMSMTGVRLSESLLHRTSTLCTNKVGKELAESGNRFYAWLPEFAIDDDITFTVPSKHVDRNLVVTPLGIKWEEGKQLKAELEYQNQRYKQALEEILRQHENEEEIDDYDFMWNVQQIASKALEGGNEN